MTTAAVASPSRNRISRWTIVLLVGLVDAVVGLVGVTQASGALLVASWVLLVAGVDTALFALWRSRRTA
jgi:hypothetical protein